MIDGNLAFEPVDKSISGICTYEIYVSSVNEVQGEPKSGEVVQQDMYKTYWRHHVDACNDFPIFYGRPLEGQPFVMDGHVWPRVAPKALVPDVVYYVQTSDGPRLGTGWFRLDGQGGVENLTDEQIQAQMPTMPSEDARES